MATYVKQNGDQFNTQYGTPSGGIATLQAPDSATDYTATLQPKTGVLALVEDVNCQQGIVKGYLTNTPPGTPTDGDTYIIGGAPTGAWAGKAYYVTAWSAALSTWQFYTPQNGWFFNSNFAREIYRYTNGTWEIFYQEGTWTPFIYGTTVAGNNTYSVQTGRYRRIGSMCFACGYVLMTSKDAAMSGPARMGGLPITVSTDTFSACSTWVHSLATDMPRFSAMFNNNSTNVLMFKQATNAPSTYVDSTDISSTSNIHVAGNYLF
jgi:hypothetical protein